MDQDSTIADIEQRAYDARISIRSLCHRAGVHPTTFYRWKKSENNPEPVGANLGTVNKLYAALEQIAAENQRNSAHPSKAVAA